jgi:hypothetical protein
MFHASGAVKVPEGDAGLDLVMAPLLPQPGEDTGNQYQQQQEPPY